MPEKDIFTDVSLLSPPGLPQENIFTDVFTAHHGSADYSDSDDDDLDEYQYDNFKVRVAGAETSIKHNFETGYLPPLDQVLPSSKEPYTPPGSPTAS